MSSFQSRTNLKDQSHSDPIILIGHQRASLKCFLGDQRLEMSVKILQNNFKASLRRKSRLESDFLEMADGDKKNPTEDRYVRK
jgi:hypothetical protein